MTMKINNGSNKEMVTMTLREGIIWVSVAFTLGMVQTALVSKAYFSSDSESLQTKISADKDIAKALVERCDVFSNLSIAYKTDGTRMIDCTVDLRYFDKLGGMKEKARKWEKPGA